MINFDNVENLVKSLKVQVATNQIDDKLFEDRLLELIDIAEDGHYWMYGHESERWFRHDGQTWVPDNPDRILALRAQTDYNAKIGQDIIEEIPVNQTWFFISLVSIVIIGGIVYFSTVA